MSLFLGVMHTLSDLPGITESVVVRSLAMVGVGSVMGELSGRYKRSEKKLKQYTEQLEKANILLKEADRLKSIFLASMSHELRTPLNSIIGFTGIILQGMAGELNDEQNKQLTLVKKSAHHLLGLINDLLDISKIESRKVKLSLEEFRLNDAVEEAMEVFLPTLNEKGLELLVEIPEDITFFSDKRRIKQVLMNLVDNSVKFTDQGSLKISAKILKNHKVEVRVTDTGIGIKKENMKKLFLPFQQIDMSLTKSHKGTGLGLHLTQKLVNLLGGDISAKSEYGRGSEFTFTLPLKYKEEQRGEEDISG
ncbi:MAG: sensor histidine kinase [Acidobacteriota bacterium]